MNFSDVVFLDVVDVERIHDGSLNVAGGLPGIRDRGLLESAVAAPKTTVFGSLAYPSLARMAAALGFAIAKNHAFLDGNKRAAVGAVVVFLEMNGMLITPPTTWAQVFEDVASGTVTRDDLAGIIAHEMGGDVVVETDD